MKKVLVLIMAMIMVSGVAKAQFPSSNQVYAYYKVDHSLDENNGVLLFLFGSDMVYKTNDVVNRIKSRYKDDPDLDSYFKGSDGRMKTHSGMLKCTYDRENTTSKRITYDNYYKADQYSSYWGTSSHHTYFSFSPDRESLIVWYSNSTMKERFIRISLSEFAPKSQNRDFLYE